MLVPFGEYMPDMPSLGNPGATVALNVYPRTPTSYGPIADLSVYSDALTARCQGAFAGRDTSGNPSVFAGDASKLYKISAASFSDVSVSGGYTTGSDEKWSFTQYGARVIATNYANAVQSYVLGSSSAFAALSGNAPKGRHVTTWRDFVVLGNVDDGTYGVGAMPDGVWWCAQDDPTSWPTPGSSQSDYQRLPGGGWVQAVVGAVGGADGLVICETSIYRATYEGPPTIFRFDEIERSRGTPAPGSVISNGRVVFYLGEDGFYMCDGAQSIPIGNSKVDKTFYADLDQSYFHRITAAVDPINKLVIWSYPGSGSGGTPDTFLIYNWELGRWATAEISCEMVFRSLSEGYTLEDLDSINSSLDALPFSLDSRAWTGGRILLSAFNTDHKLSYLNGSNLEATLETGEFSGPDGRRIFVTGIRPIVDGGTITASVRHRSTPQAALTTEAAASAGDDGVCPFRVSTRYGRARVSIAAGGSWSHAQGVEPRFKLEGLR